ncbi:mechanosensitive ion channel family protein [Shimia abyssi]|uniref:Small-conductance mechanosensitive channel n=1 Tax=Shimia abyssi TaxID=1662395 RepID=A0A2P8FAK9_9RHOB|nr:mechanosensitive ion channel domain-containing protein [Shimia abyssi]PSL18749.1 small-conductance mechanosensitive channel [Shimia abyssi]
MIRHLFSLVLTILFLLPVHFTAAQEGDDPVGDAAIAQIVQEAAENGMSVIILDASGNVVGAEETIEPDGQSEEGLADDMTSLMKAQAEVDSFRAVLSNRLDALPAAINEVLYILRASSPDGTISAFFKTLVWMLVFLFVGMCFERFVYGPKIAGRLIIPLIRKDPVGYSEKLPFLVARFAAGLVGVATTMLIAFLLGLIIFGPAEDTAIRFTIVSINAAFFMCRAVSLAWRMILSPYLPQYRIPPFSTKDAKRLHHWVFSLAILDICTNIFGEWLKELGLNYDVYAMMSLVLTAVFAVANIALIFANKNAISMALRNGRDRNDVAVAVRWISILWAPLFMIYVLYGSVEHAFDLVLNNPTSIGLIAGAYIILMSTLVVYATINFGIERYFARARSIRDMNDAAEAIRERVVETGEISVAQEEQLEEIEHTLDHRQVNTFEALARRVSGILAVVAGVYAAISIFGAQDLMDSSNTYSDRFLDVAVILFIGYIVFHSFRIWIDTRIREEQGDVPEEGELGDEGGAGGASRLATLLPLFRSFILLVIIVTITLIVMLELGVNVSPLFAGAGVVGLAVGFGAQSLVKDIFSGAFFLFDDAFRKGEYIDIGSVKGTVEKISVRSFQLRHHLGPLHTIPFGEIQFLTNYSRDWVIMKLPLRVTYDTNVERVRKLIKNLGVELLDDPVIGHNFIQPLKSQGVIEMQDSAMIIRVKFMTKPGDQWLVRKKVFQEIRDLFEREGIKFAHREVTVRLADGKADDLDEKQKEAVTGAVQSAIEVEDLQDGAMGGDDR